MSPEQAECRLDLLGPASDVYSLGATLFPLLTGKAPVVGRTDEVLQRVRTGDIVPPRRLDPTVDAALEAVCLKAMAMRVADRYASPRALADDIEHWLADEPVSGRAEALTVRARRWTRQHRSLVTSAAAVLLVATVGSIVAATLLEARNQALDTTNRQLDAANASLKRINDGLDAANQELKASNEKLEMARGEIWDRKQIAAAEQAFVLLETLPHEQLADVQLLFWGAYYVMRQHEAMLTGGARVRLAWAEGRIAELIEAMCMKEETKLQVKLTDVKPDAIHEVKLTAGKAAVIEIQNGRGEIRLRLQDAKGKALAQSDDRDIANKSLNTRILFIPSENGVYRIVATRLQSAGRHEYDIIIRQYSPPKSK